MKDELYNNGSSLSASDTDFLRFLEYIVEELIITREYIVIEDFNSDFMLDLFYTRKLQTILLSMRMKQYVEKSTRITKDSRSVINLIFSNKKLKVSIIHEPKITDHA